MDNFEDLPYDSAVDFSTDWIRIKVEREGAQARNIIKYNLPFSESQESSIRVTGSERRRSGYGSGSRASSAGNSTSIKSAATMSSEQSSSISSRDTSQRRRVRRRQDYHALYWGQMIDTLKRTIDEIYAACELDECEIRCKEVIMILNHSEQDFKSLIEKMSLLERYGNRPTSLAWDERKISPARPIMRRVLADLDLSPPTLIGCGILPSITATSDAATPNSALAWGSDEEDLLNEDVDDVDDSGQSETRHFDAAIESVASTERLLRSELGREEASLRRNLKTTTTAVSAKAHDDEGDGDDEDEVTERLVFRSEIRRNSSTTTCGPQEVDAAGFVCRACARQAKSRRSVAVETETERDGGGGGMSLISSCGGFGESMNGLTGGCCKARIPGRGIQMHEKLMAQNRSRCGRSIQEIEAKQARARFLRQRHLLERSNRVRELSKKVEEVRKQKLRLIQQRRNFLEQRLLVAEENRRAELERRILKAHDEEIKGREIAFIQSLEAEQKQHTIFAKHEISCARLKARAEVRRRRLEEKAEREEAAKLRRIELEAERLARLDELQARWQSRASEIAARDEQTRRVRRAAARERELHREAKLASLEQAQRQHIEQLRSKIATKQRECERRHQETLSGIRRKALEMSAHQQQLPNPHGDGTLFRALRGYCRLCRVAVDSRSHFESKGHRSTLLTSLPACLRRADRWDIDRLNAACFVELETRGEDTAEDGKQRQKRMRKSEEIERQRTLEKRLDVVRQRMNARSILYRKAPLTTPKSTPVCPQQTQLQKLIKEARRYCNLPESGPWVASRVAALEKALHGIQRITSTNSAAEDEKSLLCCFHLDLASILISLVDVTLCQRYFDFPIIPARTVSLAAELLLSLCERVPQTPWHLLFNGDLSILVDCLTVKLARLEAQREGFSTSTGDETTCCRDAEEVACIHRLFVCLLFALRGLKSHPPPPLTGSIVAPASKKASNFITACLTDLVGYSVNSGLMEVLTNQLSSPHLSAQFEVKAEKEKKEQEEEEEEKGVHLALSSLQLLIGLTRLLPHSAKLKHPEKSESANEVSDDPTFFFDAVAATEVFGVISLLYDVLQVSPNHRAGDCHDNIDVIGRKLRCGPGLAEIVLSTLKLLNYAAQANLGKIQEVVSNDATSVQLRHILGLIFLICAPIEEEKEPVKDSGAAKTTIIATIAKPATIAANSTVGGGGCLAGKRRKNTPALIPSGAREISVKKTPPSTEKPKPPQLAKKGLRPNPDSWQTEILHEAIICLGYLTLGHVENQRRLCVSGQSATPLLLQLCQLPLSYFSQPHLADILFPTLIASCFVPKTAATATNNTNTSLLVAHLNPALLANFIEARSLERTLDDKKPSNQHKPADESDYHRFENRFPPALWAAAKTYFAEAKTRATSNEP